MKGRQPDDRRAAPILALAGVAALAGSARAQEGASATAAASAAIVESAAIAHRADLPAASAPVLPGLVEVRGGAFAFQGAPGQVVSLSVEPPPAMRRAGGGGAVSVAGAVAAPAGAGVVQVREVIRLEGLEAPGVYAGATALVANLN